MPESTRRRNANSQMTTPSSFTPDQALQRVLKISRLNGWSVVLFAGFCTLITVLLGDVTGIVVGLMVIAAGIMEVRGNRMLRRRDANGMVWLIRAQLFLLGVILIYGATRIMSYGGERGVESLSPDMRNVLKQLDIQPNEIMTLLRKIVWIFYGAVMGATCIYQGGFAFYYSRRKALVEQALVIPPSFESKNA